MKLIMERFRKSLNEMPAGVMPLTVGAATAAGKAEKAEKAKEKAKEEIKLANNKLLKKLVLMGSKPQFIELDPGDIKGAKLGFEHLADTMSSFLRDYRNNPKTPPLPGGATVEFIVQNGKIIYGDYNTRKAVKISPAFFAGMLGQALQRSGLSDSANETIGFRDILGI